jgi:hypothetical protein
VVGRYIYIERERGSKGIDRERGGGERDIVCERERGGRERGGEINI